MRLVEAEGFDLQPCGGTHPRNTSEVGVVVVLGHERHKGGTPRALRLRRPRARRVPPAAGDRRRDLGRCFSSAPEALPEAARRLRDAAADADRRCRALLERALEGEARRLLAAAPAAGPPVVVAALDG